MLIDDGIEAVRANRVRTFNDAIIDIEKGLK